MQYDFGTIDPYSMDGVGLADALNSWRDALYTMQRGHPRPAFVVPGQLWCNDAAGPTNWVVNYYISPTIGDVELFTVNTTTGAIVFNAAALGGPYVMGGGDTMTGPLIAPQFVAQGAFLSLAHAMGIKSNNSGGSSGGFFFEILAGGSDYVAALIEAENIDGSGATDGGRLRIFVAAKDGSHTLREIVNFDGADLSVAFDGILSAAAPLAAANDGTIPTTQWVRSTIAANVPTGPQPPAVTYFTTVGSFSYPTPTGAKKLFVQMVAGGGGGGGGVAGTDGTLSSFGGTTAAPGKGAPTSNQVEVPSGGNAGGASSGHGTGPAILRIASPPGGHGNDSGAPAVTSMGGSGSVVGPWGGAGPPGGGPGQSAATPGGGGGAGHGGDLGGIYPAGGGSGGEYV